MDKLKLEVLFAAVDKITRPLKAIQGGSNATAQALKAAREQLKELNRAQQNITAFQQVSKGAAVTANALKAAQAEVKRIQQAIAQTPAPTRDMARALQQAKDSAAKLKQEHGELIVKQQRLRDTLKASGIETGNLNAKQRELKSQIASATGEVNKQSTALKSLNAAQAAYSKRMEQAHKLERAGVGLVTAGAVIGAPVAKSIREFTTAEDAATQLKVAMMGANGQVNENYQHINALATQLGNKLPGTTADYQNMMTMLIRQGMSAKAILGGLGQATAYLGVQLKMPMDAAAEFASKLQDATRTTESDMMGLMDTIQRTYYLGVDSNNMLDAFTKMSPVMAMIKKQGLEAANAFAPLIVMADQAGMRGEAAGNAYRKIFQYVLDAKKLGKANSALAGTGINLDFSNGKGEFGGMDKLFANLDKLKSLNTMQRNSVIKSLFGDDAETLQAVSIIIDKGKAGYAEVQAKMAAQASIQSRVNEQLGTLKALWDAASGTFTNALVNWGEAIAPEVKAVTAWLGELSEGLANFAKEHPVLSHAIMKTAAILAILVAGFGALLIAISGILIPLATFRFGLAFASAYGINFIGMVKGIGTAFMWLGRLLLTNPLGLAITLLATAAFLIYKNWAPIKDFFINLWDGIASGFVKMVDWIREKLAFLKPLLKYMGPIGMALSAATATAGPSAPVKFDTRPPVMAGSMRTASHVSTTTVQINAPNGMDEKKLAHYVGREFERIERNKAAAARSSLRDKE